MKNKLIALIVCTITLLGPFRWSFLNNSDNSDAFNVFMFVLTVIGLLGAFVLVSESKSTAEH
ncbi:MAG: hypothetical protein EA392_09270 [Cryomorphaceae bacterium]|nr:MAG: hypothetical protein EA392_09270 [Cryomorphaceae bacterium]